MNYSTLLDVQDCLEIFTDSDTCQEIVATPTTILLNILCREVFVPQAINTIDGIITILPLLSKCTLLVSHNGSTPNRLSRPSLKKTIKDCIDKKKDKVVDLWINFSVLKYDTNKRMDFLNWNLFSDQLFNVLTPAPTPSPNPDLAQVLADLTIFLQGSTKVHHSTGTGPAHSTALSTFNPSSLPPEVKSRYDRKLNGEVLTSNLIRAEYTTGKHRYYEDGTERLFLADGTLFVHQNLDEKGLLLIPITCSDITPEIIRN